MRPGMEPDVIPLDPAQALAEGLERVVYAHPGRLDRLLKVIRPYAPDTYTRMRMGDITKRLSRHAYLRPLLKEIAEYNRLRLVHPDLGADFPLAHFAGFAQTSEGLAMVVERVAGTDGGLAPTLADLLDAGSLDDGRLAALNAFVGRLYTLDVRAGDLSAPNFVLGRRPGDDKDRWVLVDGFGDRHAIPVRSLGGWANRLGLDDCFKRMEGRIALDWDNKARQFRR